MQFVTFAIFSHLFCSRQNHRGSKPSGHKGHSPIKREFRVGIVLVWNICFCFLFIIFVIFLVVGKSYQNISNKKEINSYICFEWKQFLLYFLVSKNLYSVLSSSCPPYSPWLGRCSSPCHTAERHGQSLRPAHQTKLNIHNTI